MSSPPPGPPPFHQGHSKAELRALARSRMAKEEALRVSEGRNSSSANDTSSVHKRKKDTGYEDQTCQCARVALTRLNKNQKSMGAAEYVIVEPVASGVFYHGGSRWYHANFRARPKNDPAAGAELFFAEIKGNVWGPRNREVTKVCVVEPNDAAGLHGCKACYSERVVLIHPEGGFNVGQRVCRLTPKDIHKTMVARDS